MWRRLQAMGHNQFKKNIHEQNKIGRKRLCAVPQVSVSLLLFLPAACSMHMKRGPFFRTTICFVATPEVAAPS